MKKLILMLSFFAAIGFCACHKSPQDVTVSAGLESTRMSFVSASLTPDTTVSDGFLVGYRAEKCQCCQNNLIKIGNDTLQFAMFPPSSPKVTLVYPHPISVEWTRDTTVCGQLNPKSIIITRLIKI